MPLIAAARRGKLQDGANAEPATTQQLLGHLEEVAGPNAVQEPSLLLVSIVLLEFMVIPGGSRHMLEGAKS